MGFRGSRVRIPPSRLGKSLKRNEKGTSGVEVLFSLYPFSRPLQLLGERTRLTHYTKQRASIYLLTRLHQRVRVGPPVRCPRRSTRTRASPRCCSSRARSRLRAIRTRRGSTTDSAGSRCRTSRSTRRDETATGSRLGRPLPCRSSPLSVDRELQTSATRAVRERPRRRN